MRACMNKIIRTNPNFEFCRQIHLVAKRFQSENVSLQTNESDVSSLPPNLVVLGMHCRRPIEDDNHLVKKIPENAPIVRRVTDCPHHRKIPLVLLDSFAEVNFNSKEAIELHPEIFADNPRIDYLHTCKVWQSNYREVDYSWKPTRAELGRGKKKPWPQKGTGRARHGSTVAPQWKGGGVAHGPRGPKALYQKMLPNVRLRALTSALSIKHFQEDLNVVKDFDIPSSESEYILEIFSARRMEDKSALLVYCGQNNVKESDNISQAVDSLSKINLMPLVGLNVWSLLQHDKLVITLSALEELETKLTWHLHRYNWIGKAHNFYNDLPFDVKNEIE